MIERNVELFGVLPAFVKKSCEATFSAANVNAAPYNGKFFEARMSKHSRVERCTRIPNPDV